MLDRLLKERDEVQAKINKFVAVNEQLQTMAKVVVSIPGCSIHNHTLPRACGKSTVLAGTARKLLTDVTPKERVLVVVVTTNTSRAVDFATMTGNGIASPEAAKALHVAATSSCRVVPVEEWSGKILSEVMFVTYESDLDTLRGNGCLVGKYTKVIIIGDETTIVHDDVLEFVARNSDLNTDFRAISFSTPVDA